MTLPELNEEVTNDKNQYCITPIKYAICFVLFSRILFEKMGGFDVKPEYRSAGINGDEGQILNYCMQNCRLNVVAINTICGHFSYPAQEKEMIQFKKDNNQYFEIRNK